MALTPKKQMPANKGETGGGIARGAGRGYGAESKVVKANRKAGDAIRKMQSETIASNSVKVRKGNPSEAKRLNEFANKRTEDIASGARAKRESASIKQSKPAKVVKIRPDAKKKGM